MFKDPTKLEKCRNLDTIFTKTINLKINVLYQLDSQNHNKLFDSIMYRPISIYSFIIYYKCLVIFNFYNVALIR